MCPEVSSSSSVWLYPSHPLPCGGKKKQRSSIKQWIRTQTRHCPNSPMRSYFFSNSFSLVKGARSPDGYGLVIQYMCVQQTASQCVCSGFYGFTHNSSMVFWWTDASARIKGKGHIFSIHDTDILTGRQKRSSGDPYESFSVI